MGIGFIIFRIGGLLGMLVTSGDMLTKAQRNHFAIPSPDFWDSNSCRIFCRTAEELSRPLILSVAEAHSAMITVDEAADLGKYYAERCDAPIALHLDHGMHFDVIEKAIKLGFTSVMIDASAESFDENVRRTSEVVELAHANGVCVEAEIGHVGTNPGNMANENESRYTEVTEAVAFSEATGVDSLAVSIGTSHGLYSGTPNINFMRLEDLREAVRVPLVLHGGSSTGDDNLHRCAIGGIAKINIFTDFIVAALDNVYAKRPENWFSLLKESDASIREVLMHYYGVFNCLDE